MSDERAYIPCSSGPCAGELAYSLDDVEPECLGCTVCGRQDTPDDWSRLKALVAWHYGDDEARYAPGRVEEDEPTKGGTMSDVRRCAYCRATATTDAAVEAGWTPEFWVWIACDGAGASGGAWECSPDAACPTCTEAHLVEDDDGAMVAKPGHEPQAECGRCGETPCACPECICCRRTECDCVIEPCAVELLSDEHGTVWGAGLGCQTHKTEV